MSGRGAWMGNRGRLHAGGGSRAARDTTVFPRIAGAPEQAPDCRSALARRILTMASQAQQPRDRGRRIQSTTKVDVLAPSAGCGARWCCATNCAAISAAIDSASKPMKISTCRTVELAVVGGLAKSCAKDENIGVKFAQGAGAPARTGLALCV